MALSCTAGTWGILNMVNWLTHQSSIQTALKGGYTLVTLPRILTPYRDSVDGTRDHITYQKLVTR